MKIMLESLPFSISQVAVLQLGYNSQKIPVQRTVWKKLGLRINDSPTEFGLTSVETLSRVTLDISKERY